MANRQPTEVINGRFVPCGVDGGGGDFHVVMPLLHGEPIRELLDERAIRQRWNWCSLELSCVMKSWMCDQLQSQFARARYLFRDLMELRHKGGIPIDVRTCGDVCWRTTSLPCENGPFRWKAGHADFWEKISKTARGFKTDLAFLGKDLTIRTENSDSND